MMQNDPNYRRLQQQTDNLQKQVRELNVKTQRSEYTGGVTNYTFANLPSPNHAGMMAYCSNARKSGEGVGAGTGVLAVATLLSGTLQWVRCDDLNAPLQV